MDEVELAGVKEAYVRDAVAAVRLFAWLDGAAGRRSPGSPVMSRPQGSAVTEYDVVRKLEDFRRESNRKVSA